MYAIAGGKGGCGKTTTVCGMARALVRSGHSPIVVDADVDMPDLHDRVGADLEPGLDALGAGAPLDAVLQEDHDLDGVDVVASGTASGSPDRRDGHRLSKRGPSEARDAPGRLRQALDRLTPVERPVLVDCPAGAGPDVAVGLGTAERAVVVSTDTRESLEDAAKTAAMSSALETPVACLCLRETAADHEPARGEAGQNRTMTNTGQTRATTTTGQNSARGNHGQDATRADDRLRRLIDAPTVVRVPSHRRSASDPRERPRPSVSRPTRAARWYDRLARVTVLRSHRSGSSEPQRGNLPVR